MSEKKFNPHARRKARRLALQGLYQWQIAQQDLKDIEQQYLEDADVRRLDVPYFCALLHGVPRQLTEIDTLFASHLDRHLEELDPIELALLRIASYELLVQNDVPYKVVINEALELAKLFGAEDSHKYVNGVLDKVAKTLHKS